MIALILAFLLTTFSCADANFSSASDGARNGRSAADAPVTPAKVKKNSGDGKPADEAEGGTPAEDDDPPADDGKNGGEIPADDGGEDGPAEKTPAVDDGKVKASSFGGHFRSYADGSCSIKNPRTGDCSCPAGYDKSEYHNFDDHSKRYYCVGTSCGIRAFGCFKKPVEERIGGFYRTFQSGECANANYYTGGCGCPNGYSAQQFHEFQDAAGEFFCQGKSCGVKVFACIAAKAAVENSGGIFRKHNRGDCQFPNTLTGACSCPTGYAAEIFDEFTDIHRRHYCADETSSCGVQVSACVKL